MKYSPFLLVLLFACTKPETSVQLVSIPDLAYPTITELPPADTAPHRKAGDFLDVHEPDSTTVRGRLARGQDFPIVLAADATPALIAVRLEGPVRGLRLRNQGQPGPGETVALTQQLVAGAKTDREKAESIFRFVVDQFEDWWYPSEGYDTIEAYPRNVAVQLWGYGYGFCSDSGQIAAALWREAGFDSKVVQLHPYHTMAAVKYDGAWHAYDLQHRSFWEKPDGSVASLEELATQPELFNQRMDRFGHDAIGYPPMLSAYWYSHSEHQTHASKSWTLERDFSIDLRQDETYEIHYVGKPTIYHPDLWLQYYGERTFDQDPPWPLRGLLCYRPTTQPHTISTQLTDGRKAWLIPMHSPYLFTEGLARLPNLDKTTDVFVYAHDRLHYVGPMISGMARLGKYIEGTYSFALCLVPKEPWTDPTKALAGLELKAYTQMAPLSQPELKPGDNFWEMDWQEGLPTLTTWFRENGSDLSVSAPSAQPEHPQVGEPVTLRYTVTNNGRGRSLPTQMEVRNATTALLAEQTELVGIVQVPPLEPGATSDVSVVWLANTRMTWYGQNPLVQRFMVLLDRNKQTADASRSNNFFQHYLHLADASGQPAPLPGYTEIGLP